ncbi:hypothetical protein [Mammaliicoccus vitulinus]|uniref:hypothetical protein n=1 Tax=Mammaliicoccus vitulinus TaxID=71237 RepID=UPI003B9FFC8D
MDNIKKQTTKLTKGLSALAIASSITISMGVNDHYVDAAENNSITSTQQDSGKIVKIDDNTARIDLHNNMSYSIDKNGQATLKDKNTNKTEILPNQTKDKNGNDISLVYFENDGKLGVYAQSAIQTESAGKCISGITGGAVTGGTTLGLAGAGVGTVTLPVVGTVGGGVVGAVGGTVGGGLTGGATFC